MTNDMSQGPSMRPSRHGGGQLSYEQATAAAQLSQSLPVLDVDDLPQQHKIPVITFDHVT